MPRYREYVYLSNDKVRQFQLEDDAWWRRIKLRKIGAKVAAPAPTVAEFSAEIEIRDQQKADQVEQDVIDGSRWFEEDVTAGDWVLFEGRLGLLVLNYGPAAGAVVFAQVGAEPGATRRLVLHGSARHLAGRPASVPAAVPGPAVAGGDRPYSSPPELPGIISAVAEDLGVTERSRWQDVLATVQRGRIPPNDAGAQLVGVLEHLDRQPLFAATARSVCAVARVTALLPYPPAGGDVLVATPLVVRSIWN